MYTQRVHGVSVYIAPIRRCLQLGDMTTRVVDDGFRPEADIRIAQQQTLRSLKADVGLERWLLQPAMFLKGVLLSLVVDDYIEQRGFFRREG